MADEKTPDRLDALLTIIEDPKAARKLADQMAAVEKAKGDLAKLVAEHDAREKRLNKRDEDLNRVESDQQRERDRLAKQEDSLTVRARLITAGEQKLQGEVVAHGQEHGKRSAELNTREQKVGERERELEAIKAELEADRLAIAAKLKKAREFVDAA